MLPGPFNSFISEICNVEEKTVVVYARTLKEAGMLTTGARGVNAPHMIPRDAARMVIALLATDKPSLAVDLVSRYAGMKIRPDECSGELPPVLFGGDPTLEQVLTRVLAAEPGETDHPLIEIRQFDKSARLQICDDVVAVFRDAARTGLSLYDRVEQLGIQRIAGLAPYTLQKLAVALWADRFRGTDAEGLPLDLRHPWNAELRGEAYRQRVKQVQTYIRERDVRWRDGT